MKPLLAGGELESISAHVTSDELDLVAMEVADPEAVTLPARSVTTLVLELAGGK